MLGKCMLSSIDNLVKGAILHENTIFVSLCQRMWAYLVIVELGIKFRCSICHCSIWRQRLWSWLNRIKTINIQWVSLKTQTESCILDAPLCFFPMLPPSAPPQLLYLFFYLGLIVIPTRINEKRVKARQLTEGWINLEMQALVAQSTCIKQIIFILTPNSIKFNNEIELWSW